MEIYERLKLVVNADKIKPREETLEGQDFLVVPAAIIGDDAVLPGSHGPGFYPATENAKSVDLWNGRFLTVYHPELDGEPITANCPIIVDTRKVGYIFNTVHADGKLRTECWFNVNQTKSVDVRVYDAVSNGESMELSTGLGLTQTDTKGVANTGEKYDWVASNYKPDHLAILPDQIGAYSVDKGGGLNVTNRLVINQSKEPESLTEVLRRSIENALKPIGVDKIVGNEMSFSQISRTLGDLLSAKFGKPGRYWDGCICEVFPDYVVYYGEGDWNTLYKIGYTTTGDVVSLSGDPVPVVRLVTYTATANNVKNSDKETNKVDKNAKINWLIGNSGGVYDEDSRPWLEKQTDDKITDLHAKLSKSVGNQTKDPPVPPVVPPVPTPEVKVPDLLSNEDKEALEFGKSQIVNQKAALIKTIKDAGEDCVFSDAALNAMKLPELTALAKLANHGKKTEKPSGDGRYVDTFDYTGMGGIEPRAAQIDTSNFKKGPSKSEPKFGAKKQTA